MKKRNIVFIILISLFIVVSLLYAIDGIKPAAKSGLRSSDLKLITTNDGPTEIKSYIDKSGNVCLPVDKKYAIYEQTKNEEGQIILKRYYDENHLPVLVSNGYHAIEYSYSENNRFTRYLDCDMNPVQISSGYSIVERTWLSDESKDYFDMYYDYQMNPVTNTSGCYGIKYLYEEDLSVEYYYLNIDGSPMLGSAGYAHAIRTYNEDNRIETEMYFDEFDYPVATSTIGHFGIKILYNSDGKRESVISLNANGEPFINKLGYSTISYSYDKGSISTERYFDSEGKPCLSGKNWYGVRHDGKRVYYLDKNGHDMISVDSILSNYPFMVSVFGVLVCLVFLFAPRKVNWIVMCLYFLFIMYETIFFRLRHTPTINLDLFWSYRQFLSNPGLRIEILNNIWLFVPYSLGLLSTSKKKTLIIVLMLLPIVIELVQGIAGIGLFELDDLVSNGIGELIGVCIWYVSKSVANNQRNKT